MPVIPTDRLTRRFGDRNAPGDPRSSRRGVVFLARGMERALSEYLPERSEFPAPAPGALDILARGLEPIAAPNDEESVR